VVVRYSGEGSKWLPHIDRLTYIYKANQRFYQMLAAWAAGDIKTVGAIFREDGIGLRDEYVLNHIRLDRQSRCPWCRLNALKVSPDECVRLRQIRHLWSRA
jgi:hypothetical protein